MYSKKRNCLLAFWFSTIQRNQPTPNGRGVGGLAQLADVQFAVKVLDNEVPNCPVGPVVDVGSTDSNGVHPQQNLFEKVAMQNQPPV